jgi:hypothetical protein
MDAQEHHKKFQNNPFTSRQHKQFFTHPFYSPLLSAQHQHPTLTNTQQTMATKFMLVYALYDHQETIIPHFADLLSLDQCSNYILRLLEETRDGFMLRRFEIRVRDNFYFPTDTRFLCGYARDHKKHAGLQYLSPMV